MEPVVLRFVGVLDVEQVQHEFSAAEPAIRARASTMLVDCLEMTGYSTEARKRFVELHTRHRGQIKAVAVVTKNRLWHMVIATMGLASGQHMRAFDDAAEARAWLAEQAPQTLPPERPPS